MKKYLENQNSRLIFDLSNKPNNGQAFPAERRKAKKMNNITIRLQKAKEKILKELTSIIPDIKVSVFEHNQTLSAVNFKYNGERAYPGMVEGKITVHWGIFFDRICGNGTMYGHDRLFKFDSKNGNCVYDGYPTNIEEWVDAFIKYIKSN